MKCETCMRKFVFLWLWCGSILLLRPTHIKAAIRFHFLPEKQAYILSNCLGNVLEMCTILLLSLQNRSGAWVTLVSNTIEDRVKNRPLYKFEYRERYIKEIERFHYCLCILSPVNFILIILISQSYIIIYLNNNIFNRKKSWRPFYVFNMIKFF
jgi:hypothetical protein